LGLSYDKASLFLGALGCGVVKAAIWNNVQALGCEVVVTDELESYKPAAEAAGVEHQLCLSHWRKAVARRPKKIQGYEKEKELMREALKRLDPVARRTLRWLHRRFAKAPPPRKGERQSPAYGMRMLTLDILENWHRLTCYQKKHKPLRDNLGRRAKRDYAVPSTNNACENAIGRGAKIRHKAMRGYPPEADAPPSAPPCSSPASAECSPESPSRA